MPNPTVAMRIFWYHAADDQSRIRIANPHFAKAVSSNPMSADYDPAGFNWCAGHLASLGLPAPEPCPAGDRRLQTRMSLLVAYFGLPADS